MRIIRLRSARTLIASTLPFVGFLVIVAGLLGMHTLTMDHTPPPSSFPAHHVSAVDGHQLSHETLQPAGTRAKGTSAAAVGAGQPDTMPGPCGHMPCSPQMVTAGCLLAVGTIFLIAMLALPVNVLGLSVLRWKPDYRPIELKRRVLRPSLIKLSISRT